MTNRDKQRCSQVTLFGSKTRGSKASALGFTLTEVLVVVLVIAVLTAIAYPLYTKAISKSRAIEAVNLLEIVRAKQIAQYARTRRYYTDFGSMGQLTGNKSAEKANGKVVQIKDYKIALNEKDSCITASYEKGGTKFSFSAGYDRAGLGCEGEVCESFGNVVGGVYEVCAALTCAGAGERVCGKCGRETRSCNEMTGEWSEWGACKGEGECSAGNKQSRNCGNNNTGTQTRTCGGGCRWGEWGTCTGQ
ncbi:MAG: prepilin-type N-terminal cleavage/methylation domain-containing protein, partial [Elusimicrobiota bacterium]|nr:prepilin-type N-terminal cleavage/methylation domain-containing protein [Elusimicrobiota bacterium]